MELSLAPLQTYTDFHFRNSFQQIFNGVDKFYAPYLKLNNDSTIKENTKVDILPKNNHYQQVIPQLMACSPQEFLHIENYILSQGYKEVNWNMGCPYKMVTNKNWGAGILNKPDDLKRNLDDICAKSQLKLGIKMRMGLESTEEILSVLPILNDYPLTEIIIHGRFAKQLYSGKPDKNRFEECLKISKHPLCYNGDVDSIEEYGNVKTLFPTLNKVMIGRAAISKPWIFEEILGLETGNHPKRIVQFTELLYESCLKSNGQKGYALQKIKSYWEYFSEGIEDGKQHYRKLKKMSTSSDFFDYLSQI